MKKLPQIKKNQEFCKYPPVNSFQENENEKSAIKRYILNPNNHKDKYLSLEKFNLISSK
jgi:hypothetical protein